jgi:nicotinate-nucleotide pyrophosphorylase
MKATGGRDKKEERDKWRFLSTRKENPEMRKMGQYRLKRGGSEKNSIFLKDA